MGYLMNVQLPPNIGVRPTGVRRIIFLYKMDRIGPDNLATHRMLHFPKLAASLCRKRFKHFARTAEMRLGSYAECCSKISIGEHSVIRPGTHLFADPSKNAGGIAIGDDLLLGCGIHFYTNDHKFSDISLPIIRQG